MGLYSDYESFKKHFVRYWKNALDISRADLDEVRDIFDDEVSTQESCKNWVVTSVFFENGKALTIEDCLNAIKVVLMLRKKLKIFCPLLDTSRADERVSNEPLPVK